MGVSILKAIRRTFAAASLLTGISLTPALAADAAPPPTARQALEPLPIDADFSKLVAGPQQYTLLGDTYHPDLSIRSFASRDGTMAALEANGVKHLFIELPAALNVPGRKFQDIVDDLAGAAVRDPQSVAAARQKFIEQIRATDYTAFYLTPDQLESFYGITADMVVNAARHGIRVHCADVDQLLTEHRSPVLVAYFDKMNRAYQKYAEDHASDLEGLTPEQIRAKMQGFRDRFVGGYSKKYQQEIVELLLKERFEADGQLAAFIRTIAGNDKSAVFYGDDHFMHPAALDDSPGLYALLGGADRVKMVAILGGETPDFPLDHPVKDGWQYFYLAQARTPAPPAMPSNNAQIRPVP